MKQIHIRLPSTMHARLKTEASWDDKSLQTLILTILAKWCQMDINGHPLAGSDKPV